MQLCIYCGPWTVDRGLHLYASAYFSDTNPVS